MHWTKLNIFNSFIGSTIRCTLYIMQFHKTIVLFLGIFSAISFGKHDPKLIKFDTHDIDNTTKKIILTFIVPEKDFIYKDFIHCSIQEPQAMLSDWKTDQQSVDYYDPSFNATKEIFNETVSLVMTVTIPSYHTNPIYFYCSYYRKSEKKIRNALFNFSFHQAEELAETQEESYITTSNNNSFYHPVSVFDTYLNYITAILYNGINHLHSYAYIHFFICLLLLCILISISYYYKDQLQNYDTLHETLLCIQLLLIITISGYVNVYLILIGFSQIGFIVGWLSYLYGGFLYIKKSSILKTELLRTLSTFLGIAFIAGSFILLFKAIQFFY